MYLWKDIQDTTALDFSHAQYLKSLEGCDIRINVSNLSSSEVGWTGDPTGISCRMDGYKEVSLPRAQFDGDFGTVK